MQQWLDKITQGDCIAGMKQLPDGCVDCCVTSPPYFGLRDYNCDGQIGLEQTPELYVAKMVEVCTEAKRVLKPEGTLWLNLGDSYWGGKGMSGSRDAEYQAERNQNGESLTAQHQQMGGKGKMRAQDGRHDVIKPKDLIGIPWMVAFALRASGWWLRQDIIWAKPNPMPESVTDRCTKSHEYIFLLSKQAKYFYDAEAIKQPIAGAAFERLNQDIENQNGSDRVPGKANGVMKAVLRGYKTKPDSNGQHPQHHGSSIKAKATRPNGITRDRLLDYNSKEKLLRPNVNRGGFENESELLLPDAKANKRSVWTVTTKPFAEAHFATFPEDLISDCIKAGCPKDGIVLDPFMGAGTTAIVAKKLNRNFIGFELNPTYITIAEKRLYKEIGMFL